MRCRARLMRQPEKPRHKFSGCLTIPPFLLFLFTKNHVPLRHWRPTRLLRRVHRPAQPNPIQPQPRHPLAGGRHSQSRAAIARMPAILHPTRKQRANRARQPRPTPARPDARLRQAQTPRHPRCHPQPPANAANARLAAPTAPDAPHRQPRPCARRHPPRLEHPASASACQRSCRADFGQPSPHILRANVWQPPQPMAA